MTIDIQAIINQIAAKFLGDITHHIRGAIRDSAPRRSDSPADKQEGKAAMIEYLTSMTGALTAGTPIDEVSVPQLWQDMATERAEAHIAERLAG